MTVVISDVPNNNQKSDVFEKIDEFGKFQTIQYFLICLTLLMISMTHVNYVFVAENVDYR